MIKELFAELYRGYRDFAGSGALPVLFAASVFAVFIATPKEKLREKVPIVLSVIPACACALVLICEETIKRTKGRKKWAAAFAVLLAMMIVAASGKSVISPEFTEKAENRMHIPEDVYESMQAILAEEDDPTVLVLPKWSTYFESYSTHFTVVGHEVSAGDGNDEAVLSFEFSKKDPDMEKVARIAHRNGCGFVVLPGDLWPDIPITKFGYEQMKECGGCIIYREGARP
ncbi:MAG: hypothetical protein K6G58_05990 [Lachnospiraceae bacterium]|nr:hypothetical protein [Lachnospiraceae bacterium]